MGAWKENYEPDTEIELAQETAEQALEELTRRHRLTEEENYRLRTALTRVMAENRQLRVDKAELAQMDESRRRKCVKLEQEAAERCKEICGLLQGQMKLMVEKLILEKEHTESLVEIEQQKAKIDGLETHNGWLMDRLENSRLY